MRGSTIQPYDTQLRRFRHPRGSLKTFTSFDGVQIAYHDQGEGPAVMLLHGGFVDGLGQFGEFDYILPILEKRQAMFRDVIRTLLRAF